MSSKPNKDFAFNVNSAVMSLLQTYLNTHKNCTFGKALEKLGLNSIQPNENTSETILGMIKSRHLIEDSLTIGDICVYDVVKCSFDRHGIVIDINETMLWGHKITVQFIGGNPAFIDSVTEEFKQETLVQFKLNV